jgi:hypothetical protein
MCLGSYAYCKQWKYPVLKFIQHVLDVTEFQDVRALLYFSIECVELKLRCSIMKIQRTSNNNLQSRLNGKLTSLHDTAAWIHLKYETKAQNP